MNKFESQLTVFENEDFVFDLNSGALLKLSERLRTRLGNEFAEKIRNISDFDEMTSLFSGAGSDLRSTQFLVENDRVFNYTLSWKSDTYFIKEVTWINRQEDTQHSVIYFDEGRHLFEIPYHSLVEIVEKMERPAALFDYSLQRVLVTNPHTLQLLKQPVSGIASGFSIRDFFVYREQFDTVIQWLQNSEESTLSFEAKLFLEKAEGAWFELRLYKARPDGELMILCLLKSIENLKMSDKKLLRMNELLSMVVEVQSHFLSRPEGENPYKLLLDNILTVVDAQLGFVGKVDSDGDGKPVLKIHAATDISVNGPEAAALYNHYVKDDFLFRHFDNLFGACIVEAKTIMENNPPSNPHTKGIKVPGHPTIENFLGVPIFKGDKVIGLIGLGNKSGGFTDQDITDLKPFATTYSVIIEAFRSEQDKIKFEKESFEKALILTKVADHSLDLIVVMNQHYEIEFMSPSASQFFDDWVTPTDVHRKIRVLLKKTLSPIYKLSENSFRSRLKLNVKLKGEYWLESIVNIIQEKESNKVTAVIRDVSLQIQLERGLMESLKKEKQFNSFVSDFLNIISHEFKTPLATIVSSMELSRHYLGHLPAGGEISKVKGYFDKIERELGNLHKIVTQSLDYKRFVDNTPVLRKEDISVRELVEDTISKNGFQGRLTYKPEIGYDLRIDWDRFLIQTCFLNLISNALKFGGNVRKPEVNVFREGDRFGVRVTDFGIGIAQEDLPYVFTPFFRGANSGGIAGSGFGLVAVKNFVELHDGQISIQTQLDKGTEVTLTFSHRSR